MVALYIMHRDGVPDEDRRRLYQHARLGMAEQDAVNSLSHLGARITRVSFTAAGSASLDLTNGAPYLRALQIRTRRKRSNRNHLKRKSMSCPDISRSCARSSKYILVCHYCSGPIHQHFLGSCEQQARRISLPLRQRRTICCNSHREQGFRNPNAHILPSECKAKLAQSNTIKRASR